MTQLFWTPNSSSISGPSLSGPSFNVYSFGATGNGTTDDAPAIALAQAAAVAAGGGMVYFPRYIPGTTTLAGYRMATASTVYSSQNIWWEGDPRGSRIIAPRTTAASVSATAFNIDFTADFGGPYAITEIVTAKGYEWTSTSTHSLTVSTTNESIYDHSQLRVDRNSATRLDIIIDGTTLTAGFDFTVYNYTSGSGVVRVQGDGVTTVSVDGGVAGAANVVDLTAETACFIKFSGGVINITTGIKSILNGADVVTRVELPSTANAQTFAFGDAMNIDTDLEADASASGDRVYEKNGDVVYGNMLSYVYLARKLNVDLNSATTKNARRYSDYRVCLKNLTIVGEGNVEVDSLAGSSKSSVLISGVRDMVLENIGVEDTWNFGWTIRNCFAGTIKGIGCKMARNSGELSAEQYAVNLDGFNKYILMSGYNTNGSRHVRTTTNPADSSWSGTAISWPRHGEAIECISDGGQMRNASGNALDNHKGGRDCVDRNLQITGAVRWKYGTIIPKAIQHRAGSWKYQNINISNCNNAITVGIEEPRSTANEILFEDITIGGANEALTTVTTGTTAVTRRMIELTGSDSHTATQTIIFRRCHFKGDTNRFMDLDGNYTVIIEDCIIEANVLNGGFLIEFDGDTFSTLRNKLIFRNNFVDTSGWAAAVTGIIRVNGTIDVELGPNTVKGTNYNAIVAASSITSINVTRYGKITQLDQRREIVSGAVTTNVELDPRAVTNVTAVGNITTGTDDLITYSLPARSMQEAGDWVKIKAWGTTANNANAKTLTLAFGSQTILTTALTTNQASQWEINAVVIATAGSAQDWHSSLSEIGTANQFDMETGTATVTSTAAITIKCTGNATATNDIVQEGLTVELFKG